MADNQQSRIARRKQQADKSKKKGKRGNLLKKIVLLILIIGFAGLAFGAGLFAYYAKDAPKLDESLLIDPIASRVLDMNNELVTIIGPENRNYVDYDHIPKEVRDAVLATEDVRFEKHSGIDLRRLASAVLANFSRGFGSEGASTITQQVIKRSFLSDEKTLKRKAQEAWLAFQLEKHYTKPQIFEMYVNKIYYENGVYGIETAAKYYFDKELSELDLQETALLAGLPQSPYNFNPYAFPEKADKRKNIVLRLMHQHNKISKEDMEKYQKISVTETLIPKEKNQKNPYKYDSFVDQVIREVEALGDYNVFADGLTIYTTLDPKAQDFTEKLLLSDEIIQYPSDEFQAGIVLQDTKTGEIRAIGGNRYKNIQRATNYATQLSRRSPASTIKPILDYGPAIEYLNWSTYEQIVDEPYKYSTGATINNFDNRHLGQMSMREALYRSRNIPALKAFEAVGLEKSREFAANLGLEFKDFYESASIGGVEEVSPMKLAGAFAAFGNNGVYNKPHTVRKIVLRDEETEINNKVEPKIAMKDSTAYMVTDMLKDVLSYKEGSTGKAAIIEGLPAAGKTGTSNYSEEEIKKWNLNPKDVPDAWFAGYTTNYSLAVWTGYDQRKNALHAGSDQQIAKELYKQLMQHVSDGIDTPDFTMPKSVVKAPVEKGSNPPKKPSKYTPDKNIVYELFVAGTEPKQVSEAFDKLNAPSVHGEYHQAEGQILFTWEHSDLNDKDIQFDVSIKTSNSEKQSLGKLADLQYIVQNVEPGETYTIEVVALTGSQSSSPGTASVTVPKIEEEEETLPPDTENSEQENKDNKDNNGNNSNNSNNGDNGNNSNNGNNGNKDDKKTNGNNNNNGNNDNNDSGQSEEVPEKPVNGNGDGSESGDNDTENSSGEE